MIEPEAFSLRYLDDFGFYISESKIELLRDRVPTNEEWELAREEQKDLCILAKEHRDNIKEFEARHLGMMYRVHHPWKAFFKRVGATLQKLAHV